jgi:tRNA pseudouridine38-40 synthase
MIAYDGLPFHGFAESRDVRSVMGDLRGAIERVAQVSVELTGAGRTDAGVHGWGQVVSGDLPADVDLVDLQQRLNRMLAPHIAVRRADWASEVGFDDKFDARFSARFRHYRYHVWNASFAHPHLAPRAWYISDPLDIAAMRLACDPLIGEHDFTSFCRLPKLADGAPAASLIRNVHLARWNVVDDGTGDGPPPPSSGTEAFLHDDAKGAATSGQLLRFEIRANAFCHQMVRSIVGVMVEVGRRRMHAGDVLALLRAKDRQQAPRVAPPHGLVLWEVGYNP